VWLKTTKDQTESDPSIGRGIGWYAFDGSNWVPFNGIALSGTTAQRPTNPVEFQQYYDTDISVLLWFERGEFRTVSGCPGDIKSVAFQTLDEALTRNPGWDVLGAANVNIRGRYVSQATKDPGASPETELTVGAGITPRAAFETFSEGITVTNAGAVPFPAGIAFWTLVKL